MPIGFDDLVADGMKEQPAAIRVFLDFRMGCVGCPIACSTPWTMPAENITSIATLS